MIFGYYRYCGDDIVDMIDEEECDGNDIGFCEENGFTFRGHGYNGLAGVCCLQDKSSFTIGEIEFEYAPESFNNFGKVITAKALSRLIGMYQSG